MKLKLKHELGFVNIETDIYDAPDKRVVPVVTFEGDESLKEIFFDTCFSSYGAYGHGFSIEETTNFDIDCACRMMQDFEIVESDPPDGIKANPNFPKPGYVS